MKSCLFFIIISICIIYAYQLGYQRASDNDNDNSQVLVTEANQIPEESTQITETNPVETVEESTNSNESQITHVVSAGETLFLIGLKYDVLWTTIATANNITENTPLKDGTKLIIPINKEGKVSKSETLNIDGEESKKTQEAVKYGEQQWRKDVMEVVRRTIPVDYHLINSDTLSLAAQDKNAGTATVEVAQENKKIIVELVQPQEKGDNGVWYIAKITVE